MRKFAYSIILLVATMLVVAACDNYETYGDKKKKERNAIAQFIKDSAIVVISESQFEAQGETTDVSKNEYVYFDNSGVYMQIVNKGCGTMLEENKTVNLLCRFYEYNILDQAVQAYNSESGRSYDKMTVSRSGVNITATFTSGYMCLAYGSSYTSATSVPAGWLIPLLYVNLGRPSSEDEDVAKVKLIVPHSQGQSYAVSNVYPCFYVITYQREK